MGIYRFMPNRDSVLQADKVKRNSIFSIPRSLFPVPYSLSTGLGVAILNLGFLLLPDAIAPKPVIGAEWIYGSYGPLEFSVPVSALEKFATQGKIDNDLAFYTKSVTPQQLQQFRQFLSKRADISPVAIANFLYSPIGEILLERVGQVIQTKSRQSGFYALRSALILAAADPEGLTPLNVLEKFPTYGIRINSSRGFETINNLTDLIRQTGLAINTVEQEASAEASTATSLAFSQIADLRQSGGQNYQKESIQINDLRRSRSFPVDLYLPTVSGETSTPLIVISHGLGGNRQTYAYLAKHLASYGLAVAVPEHPGSNAEQIQSLFQGLANEVTPPRELVDRPLDIKFLLDQLESSYKGRLNLQQVGVIGQSYGGYTTLALAGAKINFAQIREDCRQLNETLNLSLLLQCQAVVLPPVQYNLPDPRIKAAIAINPVNSTIFGKAELSQIQAPVMLVASSADTVAPALREQIQPFTWLTTPEKYLVLMRQATHFSTVDRSDQDVPIPPSLIGPDPQIAFGYMQALSVAFMKTYIAGQSEYRSYLNAGYGSYLSQAAIPLSLIQSLTEDQLQQVITDPKSEPKSTSTAQP